MKRTFRVALWMLPWALLLAFGGWVWSVWDQFPARMAVHFDMHGAPNGWDTPAHLAATAGPFLVAMMAIPTVIAMVVCRHAKYRWLVVSCCDLFSGCLVAIFWAMFYSNLHPGSRIMDHMLILVPVMIGAIVLMVITANVQWFRNRPRRELHWTPPMQPVPRQAGRLLAEEVHVDRRWLWLFVPMIFVFVAIALFLERGDLGLLVVSGALAVVAIGVWDGFHYRFTTSGMEVRTLGLRLRWVPLSEIKEYRADEWDNFCYGWRMAPGLQAFIWSGHSGVRVRTWNGDVYLGHRQPDRLLQDLDTMMKYAH